jgi:RNA-directed DNA polymerase
MNLKKFAPRLSALRTVEQLARALGVSTPVFEMIADNADPSELYYFHRIPKRAPPREPPKESPIFKGVQELSLPEFRSVWEPKRLVVKLAHRSAANAIDAYLCNSVPGYPHENSYGYIRGRSTRGNAARHLGARRLLGVDIKDFFPSIKIGRIELALRESGIHEDVAKQLSLFLTINNELPLGLNSSPGIANLVSHKMDVEFTRMADEIGCVYTRYADDITFSAVNELPSKDSITKILHKNGFALNKSKYRESKRGQRHYVTGLSVADKSAPHVPRKMKRRLRQELFFIKKYGLENHVDRLHGEPALQGVVNRIDGTVSYVVSIEKKMSEALRNEWADICSKENVGRSFSPRPYLELRDSYWFVDEAEILLSDGSRLLAVCATEVFNLEYFEKKLSGLFEEEAGDPYGHGSPETMRSKGLHWVSANVSQRERAVRLVSVFPSRSFIAMDLLRSGQSYLDTYLKLLKATVDVAFRTADDAVVHLFIEANSSKASDKSMIGCIHDIYSMLEERNGRRPLQAPDIKVVAKGFRPALVVPDIILGAFGGYIQAAHDVAGNKKSVPTILFEQIRSRIQVVYDFHRDEIFSSRKPFVP